MFPSCGGYSQSPINIITRKVLHNDTLELHFKGYHNKSTSYNLVNTGRTIRFDYTGSPLNAPSITGSNLQDRYYLTQLHFHWGKGDDIGGSEHKLDGYQFDLELHLVHSKPDEASGEKESDQTVVVAVLYQINYQNESSLEAVMRNLEKGRGQKINETVPIQYGLRLSDLLPSPELLSFFTYTGSLTTPPCTEGIFWYILTYPKFIGYRQVSGF